MAQACVAGVFVIASVFLEKEERLRLARTCATLDQNLRAAADGRTGRALLEKIRSLSVAGIAQSHRFAAGTGKSMAKPYEP